MPPKKKQKSKLRPLRILWDKYKNKYYVIENGVRKYYKSLKGARKIETQKKLLKHPIQRINVNKPTYLDERIKFLGLRFIDPPPPGPSLEETDEGLKSREKLRFDILKESPIDTEDYLENKILQHKKLTEEEEQLYPVVVSRAKKEREAPDNAPVEAELADIEPPPVPKGLKKKDEVKEPKPPKRTPLQKLFGNVHVNLGGPPPEKKEQTKISTYDPYEYLKDYIGATSYKYAPVEYWIGPNTLVNELYPLIDFVKFIGGITEKRLDEIFYDMNIKTDIKDDDERLNTKKLKVIAQATPNNIELFKRRKLITGIRPFRKPIDQYGTGKRLPALYSDEIEDFFKDEKEYPYFGGVISADEIHLLPKKLPLGFIMNLDNSNQKGSHWVAVYISNDSIEYFDPFGKPPSDNFKAGIQKFLRNLNVPIMFKFKINRVQRQHGNSFKCGYHSMRFLDDRFSGIPFDKASGFENVKNGDNEKDGLTDWRNGEKDVDDEFEYI